MAIRSHIDPATFVRILYIDCDGLDTKLVAALEAGPNHDAFHEVWKIERARRFDTVMHETYHFWQGVRLPYVHRYAVLSFWRIFHAFKFAAGHFGSHISQWQFEVPDLYRLTIPFDCYLLHSGSFAMQVVAGELPNVSGVKRRFRVTERDLLETGASLAEWNAHVGNKQEKRSALTEPTLFNRWRKRHPAFLTAFDMIAMALDNESLALRCALPLICGAFSTNRPVQTLCRLIADIVRANREHHDWWVTFIRQEEPCRWVDLMDFLVNQIDFDALPDSDTDMVPKTYCKLTIDMWASGRITNESGSGTVHPFLSERAQQWLKAEQSTLPGLRFFMAQPNWVTEETLHFALTIEPPMTIARIALPSGRTRVVPFREFGTRQPVFGLPETGDVELLEIMTVVSIIKRATGSHYHADHRLCSHSACPHFPANYCNSYANIPDDPKACGFPSRANGLIARFSEEGSG